MHYAVCLILIGVVAGDSLPAFEKVCLKDGNSGPGFTFQLVYDQNASAIDLTVTSSFKTNLTLLKIHLYAKWESDPSESTCHDDRLLLHTVHEIPASHNVRFFSNFQCTIVIFRNLRNRKFLYDCVTSTVDTIG